MAPILGPGRMAPVLRLVALALRLAVPAPRLAVPAPGMAALTPGMAVLAQRPQTRRRLVPGPAGPTPATASPSPAKVRAKIPAAGHPTGLEGQRETAVNRAAG